MARRLLLVATLVGAAVVSGLAGSPVLAEESGATTGEVVFRLTIEGPIPDEDGFLLDVECEGDIPLCDPPGNFMCHHPQFTDVPDCEERTLEMSGELAPQTIEWRLFRVENVISSSRDERSVVLSGSWTVHSGHQVISLGYVYPGAETPGPILPDTAMPSGG